MKGYQRNSGIVKAIGAFAAGATTGSILALLFAPASGPVVRKRIGRGFRSLETSAARQVRQTRRLLLKKAKVLGESAKERLGDTREWLLERVPHANGKRPALHRVGHSS